MTIKSEKSEEISCFDALDIVFAGPEVSPVA
jgi:hypothetical protein